MSFTNNLLFSHSFLAQFLQQKDVSLAVNFFRESALDYYKTIKTDTLRNMARSWVKPLLTMQGVALISAGDGDESNYYLTNPEVDPTLPIACCVIAPYGESLDGWTEDKWLPKGRHWMARTVRAAKRLALQAGKDHPVSAWAVLTNGQQWRILKTDHLRKYEAYLEVDLHAMMKDQDDPLAAVIFRNCFSREAFVPGPQGICKLDQWLSQSEKTTAAVEQHLRTSVSDNLDSPGDSDGIMAQICVGLVHSMDQQTFTDQERGAIYRDATYLLYRLLFVLYAEARGLLPTHLPEYRAISLESIIQQIDQKMHSPGEDLIHSFEIWERILTLFDAIRHSNTALGVPKYNGGLFEDDDKPYLKECQIADAFLCPALFDLAFIKTSHGEYASIDYRDLSVRHLGSLYEGMIEYKLFVAEEDLLARRDKKDKVVYLSAAKTKKEPRDEVIRAGHVYFAQSPTERKATGTHYTPETLVSRLIEQTVLRLLNERWQTFQATLRPWLDEAEKAVGANQSRLLAHIDRMILEFIHQQVLTLRICDPAMGSGHFLVHAAHRITDFILEKLAEIPRDADEINLHPDYWRRQVVENCLYGVDINEMAVELSKLSLWLATMTLGKPLSFLDHHLVCGNSVVSTPMKDISDVLSVNALKMEAKSTQDSNGARQMSLGESIKAENPIEKANRLLEDIRTKVVESAGDVKVQEIDYKLFKEVLHPYLLIADMIVARKFGWRIKDSLFIHLATNVMRAELTHDEVVLINKGIDHITCGRPVHWELIFLDVFSQSENRREGFDVSLGNPPYLGGSKISTELGNSFLSYLREKFIPSFGRSDLCGYFFRNGYDLLSGIPERYVGFITTNTISQGDTRLTSLAYIKSLNGKIVYADRFIPWQGDATVEVELVVLKIVVSLSGEENPDLLDGLVVPEISSYLDDLPEGAPHQLVQNRRKCFIGDVLLGKGFFIEPEEANALLQKQPMYADYLRPFMTGSDINRNIDQSPSRSIICFRDMTLAEAEQYPDLLKIVRERVKPYRDKVNREKYRLRWWQFGEYLKGSRLAAEPLNRILIRSKVSEHHMLVFTSKENILADKIIIFAYDDWYHFGLLQSNIHEVWLRRQATTMRTDISYTPIECFRTFPFPQNPTYNALDILTDLSHSFYELRQQKLDSRQIGLTPLYNLLNNPEISDQDIRDLRHASAKMDLAVLNCYGWGNIDPQFGFYPNPRKKIKFGMDPDAQREIFIRLLDLNHQIAAAEAGKDSVDVDEEEYEEPVDEE